MSLLMLLLFTIVSALFVQILLAPIDWITSLSVPSGLGLLVGLLLVSWLLGESRN